MDIDQAFPTKYISAADLGGREITLAIKSVSIEDVGTQNTEQKPVVYFMGAQKGLVLNKTNAHRIKEFYGSETGAWVGQKIILYPSETDFQGKTVACIRVKSPNGLTATTMVAAAAQAPANNAQELDDEIPF